MPSFLSQIHTELNTFSLRCF